MQSIMVESVACKELKRNNVHIFFHCFFLQQFHFRYVCFCCRLCLTGFDEFIQRLILFSSWKPAREVVAGLHNGKHSFWHKPLRILLPPIMLVFIFSVWIKQFRRVFSTRPVTHFPHNVFVFFVFCHYDAVFGIDAESCKSKVNECLAVFNCRSNII